MAKYKVFKEPERDAPEFAKRLITLLNKRQMTQAELSEATSRFAKEKNDFKYSVSESSISTWLGKRKKDKKIEYANPGVPALIALSKVLDVSIDYLLGISPVPDIDPDVRAIEKRLGLSSESQKCFAEWKTLTDDGSDPELMPTLDSLLQHKGFDALISSIIQYKNFDRYYREDVAEVEALTTQIDAIKTESLSQERKDELAGLLTKRRETNGRIPNSRDNRELVLMRSQRTFTNVIEKLIEEASVNGE